MITRNLWNDYIKISAEEEAKMRYGTDFENDYEPGSEKLMSKLFAKGYILKVYRKKPQPTSSPIVCQAITDDDKTYDQICEYCGGEVLRFVFVSVDDDDPDFENFPKYICDEPVNLPPRGTKS